MYGNTSIMKSGYWGKYEVLRYLLLKGADLEAQNDDGMTAIILSAKDNKFDCVKFLVERGANLEAKGNTGCTALIAASENGHLEIVKLLAEKGALLDVQDEDLWSALIYAARNGHSKVVVFLANHGANFGLVDKKGKTALDVAKTDDIKVFLTEFPARMSADLIRAAASGNVKAVGEILAKGVSVEIEDANGDRALHAAAKAGHMEVLTLLHAKGVDFNSKGMYGNTALIKVRVRLLLAWSGHNAGVIVTSHCRRLCYCIALMIATTSHLTFASPAPASAPASVPLHTPLHTPHQLHRLLSRQAAYWGKFDVCQVRLLAV
jgi:ankyrin repeat protein